MSLWGSGLRVCSLDVAEPSATIRNRHFAWQAQHFRRVVWRVFANRIVRAVSSGDKVQIPWQAWHFVRCDEIDGSLARNIDFEVANLEVPTKTPRKTSTLKLQSVQIGESLARNARFEAPACLVSILWFSSAVAVSMREAARPVIFEGFKTSCHAVLRGRRGTL